MYDQTTVAVAARIGVRVRVSFVVVRPDEGTKAEDPAED